MSLSHITRIRSNGYSRKMRPMIVDLVIGLLSIVLSAVIMLMVLYYFIADRDAVRDLQQEADRYFSYLSRSLELPLWTMDNGTIRQIGDAYMTSELFSFIEIVSNEETPRVVYSNLKSGDRDLVYREGPLSHSGEVIGHIRIGLSTKPYEKNLHRLLNTIVWITAVIVLAIGSATWFMLRLFVQRPLKYLMDFANDIGMGNYERGESKIRHYEIAMVHDQLFAMAGQIEKRECSLEDANVKLRSEVARREAGELELTRLRNYLYNIINSMPSILVAVDRDGRVTQWNKKAAQTTGLSFEEVSGQALDRVFPRFAGEMIQINKSISERRVISIPKLPKKTDSEPRYEDVTIFPLTANGVEGAVIRVDDVTERVRMEEMIVQSEKMLSVGGMAAGIAHEINNPLAGIIQTAVVLTGRLGGAPDVPSNQMAAEAAGINLEGLKQFMEIRGIPKMLGAITESANRMASIVHNMLSFARKADTSVSLHQLEDLLDVTAELATADYDLKRKYDFKQIEIRREYARNLPSVPCEAGKLQQVLLNLLRNGAQAMHKARTESPRFIFRTAFDPDRMMAIIEIEDNGPGMDEETRNRVFEPFFTTKPVGIGTGLGLSVSYFIITENHGGEMTVTSSPGAGTTFIIKLPVEGKSADDLTKSS